jgi:hypothetical protein
MRFAMALGVALTCGLVSHAQAPAAIVQPAATIERVNGRVFWRASRKSDPSPLETLGRRTLNAGESLMCDEGATVTLVVYGRVVPIDRSMGWYPIPFVPSGKVPHWWERYGERGGATATAPFPKVIG